METKTPRFPLRASSSIELDPVANDERKRRSARHVTLVVNPLYRFLGFLALGGVVVLHGIAMPESLRPGSPPQSVFLLVLYPLVAWAVLYAGYDRIAGLATAIQIADIVMLVLVVYLSGGEKSLLFMAPMLRVIDQTHTTFRRALLLGHLAFAGYLALIAWLVLGEGREVSWPVEAVRLSFLYAGTLYTALMARAADIRKERTTDAIGLARASKASLERQEDELLRVMHRNQLILQSAGVGIVGCDLEGRVTFANDRAAKTIGLNVDSLVGTKGHDLAVHSDDAGNVCDGSNCPLEAALRSQKEEHGENAGFFRPDGSVVPVSYTSAPIVENEALSGVVFSFRDISERKQLQRELIAARDAAEAGSRAKSVFLANMSHELRTPLNAIIGYSEMLGEQLREEGEPELASDAEKIRTAGGRLLGMVTDLIDIAKLEAGRLTPSLDALDVRLLLESIGVAQQEKFARRGNRLEIACENGLPDVQCDGTMLRRILEALLDNANKFTENRTSQLSASRADYGEDRAVEILVADEGPGLSNEQVSALFEPFAQVDASITRAKDGAGLGLALSRRLAKAMGATLGVDSAPGLGSVFRLRLPLYGEATATAATEERE
ncbi:MAG: PAS domain-containing sensor histidine kinase [Thermoanaerobaculia bacterium]|nr:PAS domain-containing sensor histidine kinase [Thermoanaerobaculia bacterium]